ncbi:uncharacterized protein N7446_003382 [Penicillium canescens]|uniref:Myb-like DNA-binding domain-containing protein n=1 Tax=Penicillium canescens TaxID=5083 RepID=A0AAD6IFV1_PENCN|nr:uncharacterized protein N7446_003382 [Penicillium canescens]KAJ6045180.1 hypothetical protein N7460_006535 [Penicillium canescens]KAJ6056650.1 hypothetical protein N7444_005748 [Penicillium canescens]KAJ6075605.1 hypothetical protein N7446_003382 [Penicillium canescens]
MAKTLTPKKVTKPSSAQGTPSKATKPKDANIDKDLLFLWSCLKTAEVQFDFPAVAQGLGIKTNAARMRYMRLKSKIEAMDNEAQKGTAKTELEDNGQPESESHEQRKVKEEMEDDEAAQL